MYDIGVFGATGAVGEEIIRLLIERKFPIKSLRLFASSKSMGRTVYYDKKYILQDANAAIFSDIQLAFFAISSEWSKANINKAKNSGCLVIDNSSAFRNNDNVPLVIPGINEDTIKNAKLISNPNCTTAIAALPLHQIHKKYRIKKIILSTYQAASGAGNGGMGELLSQTKQILSGQEPKQKVFPYPLAFNLIPCIDSPQENNYTREEMKIVHELRRILGEPNLQISCTCVRVPTLRVHAESITIETSKAINLDELKSILKSTPGIELRDDLKLNIYPMPFTANKKNNVQVGRLRKNPLFKNSIDMFIAGDQLLRGAALNAVEIAEHSLIHTKEKEK